MTKERKTRDDVDILCKASACLYPVLVHFIYNVGKDRRGFEM